MLAEYWGANDRTTFDYFCSLLAYDCYCDFSFEKLATLFNLTLQIQI